MVNWPEDVNVTDTDARFDSDLLTHLSCTCDWGVSAPALWLGVPAEVFAAHRSTRTSMNPRQKKPRICVSESGCCIQENQTDFPKFQSLNLPIPTHPHNSHPDDDDDEEHSHDEHQGCEEPDGAGEKSHVPTHERARRLINT